MRYYALVGDICARWVLSTRRWAGFSLSTCRNCLADPDETALMTYLPILILVSHHDWEKLSHIVNPLILSQLASVVEDSRWSSTVQLNALLLLSYLKIDDAFYCHLLSITLRRAQSRDLQYAGWFCPHLELWRGY